MSKKMRYMITKGFVCNRTGKIIGLKKRIRSFKQENRKIRK